MIGERSINIMNKKQELKQQIENAEKQLVKMKEEFEEISKENFSPDYFKSYENFMFQFGCEYMNIDLYASLTTKKIYAQLKLQYIADKLNDGWSPDWRNSMRSKHYIWYCNVDKMFGINYDITSNAFLVYFKSKELAQKAIEIMGEDMEYLK
jgi:hypothetical protein